MPAYLFWFFCRSTLTLFGSTHLIKFMSGASLLPYKDLYAWLQGSRLASDTGWLHLKCIINCLEERIWCLYVIFLLTGQAPFSYILITNVLKRILVPFLVIRIDALCCHLGLFCGAHLEMCYPTLLYWPMLFVILRNVRPYSVICHSSVIWNCGVHGLGHLFQWPYQQQSTDELFMVVSEIIKTSIMSSVPNLQARLIGSNPDNNYTV